MKRTRLFFLYLLIVNLVATPIAASTAGYGAFAGNCNNTSVGFTPLNDLGPGQYQGQQGGLYPGGSNDRPSTHEAAGLALASSIQPLASNGLPAANGQIVFLSIGMSNTFSEFGAFETLANADPSKNPFVTIVNGAQPGHDAEEIADPAAVYWHNVDTRLAELGLAPLQVQAAWLKQADAYPQQPFPDDVLKLHGELESIVQILHDRFPNLKIVYLSSRIYAGYATIDLNPEPYAYHSGFAVKWLIEAQIEGDPDLNFDPDEGAVAAPWLAWGPYLWADGLKPRSDGLIWQCGDFADDGTHPSATGQQKVAGQLLHFLKSDATAAPWFFVPHKLYLPIASP